jgi:hypothetical protein
VTCYIISIYLILITLRQVGEPIVVRDSHRPAESHRQTLLLKVVSSTPMASVYRFTHVLHY